MEKTQALNMLVEAADLVKMIEDIAALPNEKINSNMAGIKLNLRMVRERILASHDRFASEYIAQARAKIEPPTEPKPFNTQKEISSTEQPNDNSRLSFKRRDLRAEMEKSIER